MASATESARTWRPQGLVVLLVLVVSGIGVTAGYLQWKAPEIRARRFATEAAVAAAPSTTEGRLQHWTQFGDPQIHHRLTEMRLSAERPWLVTHAVGRGADDPDLALFGVDLAGMPRDLARVDGERVVVTLPAPRELGRGPIEGDRASYIPIYADARAAPDAAKRAQYLASWALERLGQALERDIPGARFTVEIGEGEAWAR